MDYLIGLYRPDRSPNLTATQKHEYENVVVARVLKNRHGAVGGEVSVHIDPENLEWTERNDLKRINTRRREASHD